MGAKKADASVTCNRYVALMRGINVGGKNKLPMRDLVAIFEQAGCTDIATYIQSGNVVFNAKPAIVKNLVCAIPAGIKESFGLTLPVVLRSGRALLEVIANNPLPPSDADHAHVMFLRDAPDARAVANLDPNRSPGDTFKVVGDNIYLRCESVAKTKLTNAYFDGKLSTVSTLRNRRTVLKLVEMAHP